MIYLKVFEAVTAKLESIPGLGDRVQLFLMGDPTPLTPEEASRSCVFALPPLDALEPEAGNRAA